jgi:hypothetical protein
MRSSTIRGCAPSSVRMIYFAKAKNLTYEVTMFDNLRESSFYEEEPNDLYKESTAKSVAAPRRRSNARFLGMSAQQRFFVSLMLLFTVCLIGTLTMFVLGRMAIF